MPGKRHLALWAASTISNELNQRIAEIPQIPVTDETAKAAGELGHRILQARQAVPAPPFPRESASSS